MDKQKQIEEMAKDICSPCHKGKLGLCDPKEGCVVWQYAKNAVENGYRKIPEGAVVLTREEYEKLDIVKKMYGSSDKVKPSDILRMLAMTDNVARKETAEKFAERVKMAFYYEFDELIPSIMADKIDEICKEITEGKTNASKTKF